MFLSNDLCIKTEEEIISSEVGNTSTSCYCPLCGGILIKSLSINTVKSKPTKSEVEEREVINGREWL